MQYRKLNLIDGTDQDMTDFMRLLNSALEAGHTKVNMVALAPMIASGVTEAFVAEADNIPVGLQIWDIGQPWMTDSKYVVLRVLFFTDLHNTPIAQAMFMQHGASQMRTVHAPATFAASQIQAPGFEYLSNCGLNTLATLYELP